MDSLPTIWRHTLHKLHRIPPKLMIVLATGLLALTMMLFTAASAPAVEGHDLFEFFQRRFVTWSPPSVTVTIAQGETQTIPVSFTTPRQLNNMIARVSPELESYVQVEPREFAWVDRGATIPLNLIVSAPADVLPGTIEGNIRLFREFRFHFRTWDGERVWTFAWPIFFAKPLPVTMDVLQTSHVSNGDLTIPFSYPSDWTAAQEELSGAAAPACDVDGSQRSVASRESSGSPAVRSARPPRFPKAGV